MKTKAYVLLCVLTLFATTPVYAQGKGHHYGRGHGKGNPHSDKQGHNENGSDKSGHDENSSDRDKDDRDSRRLRSQTADVISQLAIGTLTTAQGAAIPISAQGKLYVLLTNSMTAANTPPSAENVAASGGAPVGSSDAGPPSISGFYMALSAAGAPADAKLQLLMESLSGLNADQSRVPTAVKYFNDFVQSASPAFLAKPPAEFVALHAVLTKITAGLSTQ